MELFFPPFRLDLSSEQLWREDESIALRPKTFAVLRYLVEHPGKLVAKDELLDAVWAGTVVSDTVLKSCIRELREALDDDVQSPQYIATVHRRGYRFLPAVITTPLQGSGVGDQGSVREPQNEVARRPEHAVSTPTPSPRPPFPVLVGRDAELAQLQTWLANALRGERQIVFVTGEAGIGKTTLIDVFLHSLESRVQGPEFQNTDPRPLTPDPWISRGQCIEQYGAGEPYMPVLEAVGRLCREPGGERLIALLHQSAPTWLVQMPTLLSPTELEALQRKVQGTTRERMLREMVEAIEIITAERPLILWLEDLHWSDVSTLELLALLARRREPAQLLIIGTYRPVDVIVSEHPLRAMKQELQLHGQCQELAVRLLSEEHIAEYLAARILVPSPTGEACPEPSRRRQGEGLSSAALPDLAHTIHQRTEGNPLFIVNVVDELLAQGKLDEAAVEISAPTNIRQMIEQQFERLSTEEQNMLEVASVAGVEFSAATVAAGVRAIIGDVEQRCMALARRGQFLQIKGTVEWPDGTITTRYGFLHALYQEVTYDRIPMGQRISVHQRIGERIEAAYGERAKEIAAELAMHFEQGRDYPKAVRYLQHAGQNALHHSAHQEAILLLTKGLELLKTLPNTSDHARQELTLQTALGPALMAIKGYTASDVEKAGIRARELCQQLGETSQLVRVLGRLALFYMIRGELQTARELAEQMMSLAQRAQDRHLLSLAHARLGNTLFLLGELTSARSHLEQAITLYDPQRHPGSTSGTADPRVDCFSSAAWTLGPLGYPDQALKRSQEAVALAAGLAHPFSLAHAFGCAASLHFLRREVQLARERAEGLMTLAIEQGFPYWLAWGTMVQGWALAEQGEAEEGITQIRQGLTSCQAMGVKLNESYHLLMLVGACVQAERPQEGLVVIDEALQHIEKTGGSSCEAELYRLKGELTLQQLRMENVELKVKEPKGRMQRAKSEEQRGKTKGQKLENTDSYPLNSDPQGEAEACFRKVIEIAQQQQAKLWELRASTSLARLWQQQGKQKEAHKLLADIYNWFTEGFDTKDLQEAKALLAELSHLGIEFLKKSLPLKRANRFS